MAESFTDAELRSAFNKFDIDKSGKISKEELQNVFKVLAVELNERKLDAFMGALDPQKTGEIDFAGFRNFMEHDLVVKQSPDDLRALFSEFDKDKSGFIEAKELKKGLATRGLRFTKAEVKAQIDALDTNNDKKLSFDEFVKLFNH